MTLVHSLRFVSFLHPLYSNSFKNVKLVIVRAENLEPLLTCIIYFNLQVRRTWDAYIRPGGR